MVATLRRPTDAFTDRITDRIVESLTFGQRCKPLGVLPAMVLLANANEQVIAESFFTTLEVECLAKDRVATLNEARRVTSKAGTIHTVDTPREGNGPR